jgi:uncharacterized membrane protein YphA (DoxX/SURF4 family)
MNESTGKLILRVTLGVLILLHGIAKLTNGIDWLDGALKLELQYMFFFSAIALALIGPGRYAFNQK